MNRVIRKRKRLLIDAARDMLDYDYVLGKWGGGDPPSIDCRGLVQMAFKAIGARDWIGGIQHTVRSMWAWAKQNGRDRDEGERGDVAVLYEPAMVGKIPGNKLAIRHAVLVIRPISEDDPEGWCISAVNPKLDVKEHTIFPMRVVGDDGKTTTFGHLAVLGYINADWPEIVAVTEPPMVDPEPPV